METAEQFESIEFLEDEELNLKAVLVIHEFGEERIAIGGCRVHKYSSIEDAIEDAKQLAINMTLKYKVTNQGFGGLKLVVYQFDNAKRRESFEKVGRWIQQHKGRCYIATDTGSSIDDMVNVYSQTPYVLDLPIERGGVGPFTPMLARGVIKGLQAAIEIGYGTSSFSNLSAYVLGLGVSGQEIAVQLQKEGCKVTGFDIDKTKNRAAKKLGIEIDENYTGHSYNLLVPCAIGTLITDSNITQVNVNIIGGSANNPINITVEKELSDKGIIVIPDFVISAGALLIDDLLVRRQKTNLTEGMKRTERIYQFTRRVLEESIASGQTPRTIALQYLGYNA